MPVSITQDFRNFVVIPALRIFAGDTNIPTLFTPAAVELLVGTADYETGGFRYLDQVSSNPETPGPAFGIYQIERPTHDDLFQSFLNYRPALLEIVQGFRTPHLSVEQDLCMSLLYATVIARLVYYRHPEALPPSDNIPALGSYYKRYFNTSAGKGTALGWSANYNLRVKVKP